NESRARTRGVCRRTAHFVSRPLLFAGGRSAPRCGAAQWRHPPGRLGRDVPGMAVAAPWGMPIPGMAQMLVRRGASRGGAAALMVALAALPASAAQFSKGALIIPMQSTFQDPCGIVSAYGLIYKVLQADDTLAQQGKQRITVHWVYAPKNSPNRCIPTNLQAPPGWDQLTCPFPYLCGSPPYKQK